MPAVKPQSQTAPKPVRKAAKATSSDSKQSTKTARKAAPVKVEVKGGQKTATINLVVVKKETPGAFQMEPSDAYLKGTSAKAPFVRQAYVRKSLGVEFETQKTVDLVFAQGEQRGAAIMFKEQDRKSGKTVKPKAMQALYLLGADRLGITPDSKFKVRLSLLPNDEGIKLIINPA